jgi:hypothetical protein
MADLKEQIREIVEIVALVPESLKTMCFEMLLKDALSHRRSPASPPPAPPASVAPPVALPAKKGTEPALDSSDADAGGTVRPAVQPKVAEGSDITLADIHMKARKFLEKGEVTLLQLNDLYYKDSGGFESLAIDLGVTKMSEAQTRIALLQALHNALADGDFQTTVEAVRDECKMRKSYDGANFTANIKNNAGYFDFGTWSKDVTALRLSEAGKKELATIIKSLT